MKAAIKSALDQIGFLRPILAAKRRLRAMGLLAWTPLVPEDEFQACARTAINTLQSHGHKFGDYVEFGVSRGTSMACMYSALKDCGVESRLVGFDSFEGLGPEAEANGWETGQFASTETATRRYLASHGVPDSAINLVKGWFSDTANEATKAQLNLRKASLFLVDSDTYESSCEALKFAATLLDDEMVVMFDDWGWSIKAGKRGQKEAFDEFLEANPDIVADPLPAYREEARVFLLKRTKRRVG